MDMLDRIKKKMDEQGIKNLHQLSEKSGIPYTTIFSIFNRGYKRVSIDILNKLKECLGCSLDYLIDDTFTEKDEKELQDSIKTDNMYNSLDLRQKQIIHDIVKAQLGIADNLKVKPLKLFDQPACAGTGNYIDSDDYEIVEFINPPKTAEYAIKVQGDSMTPLIDDGDIVYINSTFQLFNNDIGVFTYQGETYIKQYKRENGRITLHALNPKFEDIEVRYPDEFFILGRVL